MSSESQSRLSIRFLDRELRAVPASVVTFGRTADLVLDEHRDMPPVMGAFIPDGGLWWLRNGSTGAMTIADRESASRVIVAAGCSYPIIASQADISFAVGSARYSIETFVVDGEEEHGPPAPSVRLNADQQRLLEELCRTTDSTGRAAVLLRSNAEMASSLGWSLPKFNRKLDNLCLKFARMGVDGLHGSPESLASDRRRRLADYCRRTGIVDRIAAGEGSPSPA